MEKHTPGPWTVEPNGTGRFVITARQPFEAPVLLASGGTGLIADPANARLIAAAPDLLAAAESTLVACVSIRNTIGYREGEGDLWLGKWLHKVEDRARAAIAKARGKA